MVRLLGNEIILTLPISKGRARGRCVFGIKLMRHLVSVNCANQLRHSIDYRCAYASCSFSRTQSPDFATRRNGLAKFDYLTGEETSSVYSAGLFSNVIQMACLLESIHRGCTYFRVLRAV